MSDVVQQVVEQGEELHEMPHQDHGGAQQGLRPQHRQHRRGVRGPPLRSGHGHPGLSHRVDILLREERRQEETDSESRGLLNIRRELLRVLQGFR